MITVKEEKLDQPLLPLHPALEDKMITYRNVVMMANTSGLPPKILQNIMQGKMFPDDTVVERLQRVFDEDIVQAFVDDYDPFRHMVFHNKPTTKHTVFQYYPATLLKPGDYVRVDDGRWLEISKIERSELHLFLFSGIVEAAKVHVNSELFTAVADHEANNFGHKFESIELKQNRYETTEMFSNTEDEVPERNATQAYIMEKLREIAKE